MKIDPNPGSPVTPTGPGSSSRSLRIRYVTAALAGVLVAATSPAERHQSALRITEWEVPWPGSQPRDPYPLNDTTVWFAGQRGDYLGILNPLQEEDTLRFQRYDLNDGAGPRSMLLDRVGWPWYAANRDSHLGRLNPVDSTIIRINLPDPTARDPLNMVWTPAGDLWFTVQAANMVGRLSGTTGIIDLVELPRERARPHGIALDSGARPWITEFAGGRLAVIDPATLEIREYDLPRPGTRPRLLAVTSDDRVWYADYAGGMLGRLQPETGDVQEWPMPGGAGSRPFGMTVDHRDRLWIVETGLQPNRLVGFDTRSESFTSVTPIPSGGRVVRSLSFVRERREIWFGTDANTIAMVSVR